MEPLIQNPAYHSHTSTATFFARVLFAPVFCISAKSKVMCKKRDFFMEKQAQGPDLSFN